jgi:hypothetical protein
VFQSYSAYTPELVELNERHLRGDAAPDNIFMAIEPIDERLPALEDGHSWLTLLRSYDFHSRAGGFFVLRRRTEPHPEPARRELSSAEHAIGDVIPVPPTSSAIFAEIDMRPSLLGRLASLFFKPPSLDLEVVTASERHKYRFVPGMARPSFPLSPLVKSTEEFLLFAARQPGFLAMERVESIRMRTHSRAYWASRFSLRLSEVELPSVDPAALALFFDARVPIDGDGAAPVACDGHLDSLNKVEPVPDQVQAVGAMRTRGWMAVSAKDGVLADRVLLALQAPDGKRSFFGTRPLWRPDVGAHYGQPSLAAAGFESVIDLSQLAGTYRLNPAHVYQGKLTLCEPTRALTVAAP